MFAIFFVVVAVGFFLFALQKTEKAVMVLPLFFPLYLYKLDFAGVPFTLIECLIYAVFLAYILRLFVVFLLRKNSGEAHKLVQKKTELKKLCKENWPFLIAILLFILAAVFSTLIAPAKTVMLDGGTIFYGRKVALGILKGWIVSPLVMLFLIALTVKKRSGFVRMLNFYTISALVLSLWGLWQVLTNTFITPDFRASGPFESANYLALYISPAVLYVLVKIKEQIFGSSGKHARVLFKSPQLLLEVIVFAILLLALLFSKSYAAMLAVFVATTCYFLFEYFQYLKSQQKFRSVWKIFVCGFLGLVVLLMVVFAIDPGKWNKLFKFADRNSSSVRVEVYTISADLIKENWLKGIGLGQFPVRYQLDSQRILGHLPYELNMLHPHNLYLAAWLNLGLLGLLSFLFIVFWCFKKSWSYLKNFGYKKPDAMLKLRVCAFALLLIELVHGFLDTPFFKNDLALLFWLIVALIILPTNEEQNS